MDYHRRPHSSARIRRTRGQEPEFPMECQGNSHAKLRIHSFDRRISLGQTEAGPGTRESLLSRSSECGAARRRERGHRRRIRRRCAPGEYGWTARCRRAVPMHRASSLRCQAATTNRSYFPHHLDAVTQLRGELELLLLDGAAQPLAKLVQQRLLFAHADLRRLVAPAEVPGRAVDATQKIAQARLERGVAASASKPARRAEVAQRRRAER